MNGFLLVLCNTPNKETAHKLAKLLLVEKLCACVNILPQVESLYLWDNKLEETTEVSMLIKTTKDCYPELEKAIKENHPYDVPEIITLDIAAGLPEYLGWINQSTTKLQ
ncbi:divalent-cation tolerance protein CutA [Aquella oligotrophica]|uniref:Divalent-cation tolerance protein CutA n=1 Tax=Aquella oligotrophica TaxID=2067065 RepID=A0A2I7N3J1_9NEIS|nr:divalent-cation tolerance protein CutA [Aquella oligotrophica]AUR51030.1 divalent-cation tolerance protein CutA [Aquella oligotrophica]